MKYENNQDKNWLLAYKANKMGINDQKYKNESNINKKISQQNPKQNEQIISNDSISVVTQDDQIQPLPFQKHKYSYIMLIISCLSWVGGFIYANENNMSPFQTTISRYTTMFFVTYIHCRMEGSSLVFFNRPHQKTLVIRNIIIALHGFVVSIMQFYIPLGIFHTLIISGQVFIFLANYFLRGVKITKNQIFGVAISFIGLALIINGRYILQFLTNEQSEFHTDFSNYASTDIYMQIQMSFLYVLWNAVWAVSVVYTKMPEYSASQILFTQSLISMLLAGLGYVAWDSDSPISFDKYLPSLIFCGFIMVANYLFTYGVMWSSNTGISTMMLMSSAVFGYFISIFRYNQIVNMVSFLGTIVLGVSAGYVIWEQQKIKS